MIHRGKLGYDSKDLGQALMAKYLVMPATYEYHSQCKSIEIRPTAPGPSNARKSIKHSHPNALDAHCLVSDRPPGVPLIYGPKLRQDAWRMVRCVDKGCESSSSG